jgi:predicted nucleotidyltransferase
MFAHLFGHQSRLDEAIKQQVLADVLWRIRRASPVAAVVFGSFAEGMATIDSDIDILFICEDADDLRKVRSVMYQDLHGPMTSIPTDFIFVTKAEFIRKKDLGGVCMIANQQGTAIFGSTIW